MNSQNVSSVVCTESSVAILTITPSTRWCRHDLLRQLAKQTVTVFAQNSGHMHSYREIYPSTKSASITWQSLPVSRDLYELKIGAQCTLCEARDILSFILTRTACMRQIRETLSLMTQS